jgi:hypothetical protein
MDRGTLVLRRLLEFLSLYVMLQRISGDGVNIGTATTRAKVPRSRLRRIYQMQIWRKLGLLFSPESSHDKLISHAANPLPIWLEHDVYRVFYNGRDGCHRSSVGAVDIDLVRRQVVGRCSGPVFEHGPESSYLGSGVSIGNCYHVAAERLMLFMGWRCPPGEHWRGEIGRLLVTADLELQLYDRAPLLGLNREDPVSLSYPWVMEVGNQGYRMWYGSTVTWDAGNGEMLHVIKHATSYDGQTWDRHGIAVPFEIGVAQAFSRPAVRFQSERGYEMWFSYRSGTGTPYRIGYAHSEDGQRFILALEQSGLDVSDSGWDSEMIEYPFVFQHRDQWYLLYNGNGYGKTGFGLAIQEDLSV